MAGSLPISIRAHRCSAKRRGVTPLVVGLGFSMACVFAPARAADVPVMPLKALAALPSFDWTGFYLGGHFGYAAGNSNWTESPVAAPGPSVSGALSLFQPFNAFNEAGSYFMGVQAGYNYMLPNRIV